MKLRPRSPTGRLHISKDKLIWKMPNQQFDLIPIDALHFKIAKAPVELAFEPAGKPARVTIVQSRREPVVYEAFEPLKPTAQELLEYAGEYDCDELASRFEVLVKEDHLVVGPIGRADLTVTPSMRDVFHGRDLALTFTREAQGKIQGLIADRGRMRKLALVKR